MSGDEQAEPGATRHSKLGERMGLVIDMDPAASCHTDKRNRDEPQFPEEVLQELAVLRIELAEHNKRILDMVQKRLDRMATASSAPPKISVASYDYEAVTPTLTDGATAAPPQAGLRAAGEPTSPSLPGQVPVQEGIGSVSEEETEDVAPQIIASAAPARWARAESMPRMESMTFSERVTARALRWLGLGPDFDDDDGPSDAAGKKDWNIENFFKTEGFCQELVRSPTFQWVTMTVIGINALWVGWAVDGGTADTLSDEPWWFQLVENLFCFFFVFEIGVRYGAYQRTVYALMEKQFLFDGALCVLMVIETWLVYILKASNSGVELSGAGALSILRMLRLTRMARLVRIFRFIPELMVLIKGMSVALKSMMWTGILLLLIIYVFAIGFRIVSDKTEIGEKHFPTMTATMTFLLLGGLFPDNANSVYEFGGAHFLYGLVLVVFIIIGTLVVMNMLIGLMCEGVSAVAAAEKEDLAMVKLRKNMQTLIKKIDEDSDGTISREEISGMMRNSQACEILQRVGVDVDGFVDVADFHIFGLRDSVSIEHFTQSMWQLRAGNAATVRDVVDFRRYVMEEMRQVRASSLQIREEIQRIRSRAIAKKPSVQEPEGEASGGASEEEV